MNNILLIMLQYIAKKEKRIELYKVAPRDFMIRTQYGFQGATVFDSIPISLESVGSTGFKWIHG